MNLSILGNKKSLESKYCDVSLFVGNYLKRHNQNYNLMGLEFEKEIEDDRGKILFYKGDKIYVNIAEIKKGFARGGHYHKYDQEHFIISGKVEYFEEDIVTKKETKVIIDKPKLIHVPANTAHLFIALEDTLFAESFSQEYHAVNYPKYRKIVEERMKK